MTTPGVLNGQLPIRPLTHLSPSRYVSLKQCTLSGVLAANATPILLPLAPSSRLGTAIHRLLEEASAGQLGHSSEKALRSRWDDLIGDVEREMLQSWLERHLVPLRSSARDFEVRRIHAFELAHRLAVTAGYSTEVSAFGRHGFGNEVWVQSKSGLVRGRIDAVRRTVDGIVIRDYKTGNVYQPDGQPGTLKKEHEVQLQIYGALYAETFGEWPSRFEVATLSGEVLPLPVDPKECKQLLSSAESELRRLNQIIDKESDPSTDSQLGETLARPNPSACAHCAFRPACAAYQQTRASDTEGNWPEDLFGELQDMRRLANGKLLLIVCADSHCSTATVRALSADPFRHPGICSIQSGDRVSVFNLRADRTPCSFTEGPSTTIYIRQQNPSAVAPHNKQRRA